MRTVSTTGPSPRPTGGRPTGQPPRTHRARPLGGRRAAYGTAAGSTPAPHAGLVDPAWTRLAIACLTPAMLAATSPLPTWVRLALIAVLVPLAAQGWPALVRSEHDARATAVITFTGLAATLTVGISGDFGLAGVVVAFSILVAFIAQMLRRDGRPGLVEDLSTTITGCLVTICGAGWCALVPGTADPAVIVPCAIALLAGALLTVLTVPARTLEALTITVPALAAGATGGILASVGFFGPSHVGFAPALQSAGACLMCGFVAGILMAASNRVLWTHRWVPGGRAAVSSAIVPILAIGAPVYAIARLMGNFVAG